jgi:hypothetical protein
MPEQSIEEEAKSHTLVEDVEGFRLVRIDDSTKSVDVSSRKDKNGDYTSIFFELGSECECGQDTKSVQFALNRDDLSAITFALSREDQQSKLMNMQFRKYKEVPVRMVVQATKDIKKGDMVIVWRKEKVPLDFEYTK